MENQNKTLSRKHIIMIALLTSALVVGSLWGVMHGNTSREEQYIQYFKQEEQQTQLHLENLKLESQIKANSEQWIQIEESQKAQWQTLFTQGVETSSPTL